MAVDKSSLKERNAEIGRMLADSRISKGLLMSDCASVISTTRQRYGAMERGESLIAAVELDLLMRYLGIGYETVWPEQAELDEERHIRRLPVTIAPDETLYVVVDIKR